MPTFAGKGETASFGVLQQVQPSVAYLFETGVKTEGGAGIVAWWKDADNCAYVGLDAENRSWYLRTLVGGKEIRNPMPCLKISVGVCTIICALSVTVAV